jgi:hypothetical protein
VEKKEETPEKNVKVKDQVGKMKSFGSSASGLQCSWGSDLDTRIPRPKMPKQALPDSVRKNLGFKDKRRSSCRFADKLEISNEIHRTKGGQEAKAYLKMKSGVPMSIRTSGLVQMQGRTPGMMLNPATEGGARSSSTGQQLAVVRRHENRNRRRLSGSMGGKGLPMREMGMGEVHLNRLGKREKYKPPQGPGVWR